MKKIDKGSAPKIRNFLRFFNFGIGLSSDCRFETVMKPKTILGRESSPQDGLLVILDF
jgi:hypothetical protein